MAEVALIRLPVPGTIGGLVCSRASPSDQLLRDEAVGILRADELVHLVPVEVFRVRAGTGLNVVSYPRGGGEAALAEQAHYIRCAMDAGVQVLHERRLVV